MENCTLKIDKINNDGANTVIPYMCTCFYTQSSSPSHC